MSTSLYRHYNSEKKLLYVGVSLNALNRLGQHSDHSHWFNTITNVTIEHFDTRDAALAAEYAAILNEAPLHNIVHKKAADAARKKREEEEGTRSEARKNLTERIVYFRPMYNLHAVASALDVNIRVVNKWIADKKIGHFMMPNLNGKLIPYVSGWQLIEHLESLEKGLVK